MRGNAESKEPVSSDGKYKSYTKSNNHLGEKIMIFAYFQNRYAASKVDPKLEKEDEVWTKYACTTWSVKNKYQQE